MVSLDITRKPLQKALKQLRKNMLHAIGEQGWSIVDFCKRTKTGRSYFYRVMEGEQCPTLDKLLIWQGALDFDSLDDMFK